MWSRKIVGWAVHDVQNDDLAAALIDETCRREGIVRAGLVLHSDNGAAMKGKTMLVELEQLGVIPSFSRPRVSDDNPFPESLFRTLKYRPSCPDKPFTLIEDARRWITNFVGWTTTTTSTAGSASSRRASGTLATTSRSSRRAPRSIAHAAAGVTLTTPASAARAWQFARER